MGMFAKSPETQILPKERVKAFDPLNNQSNTNRKSKIAFTSLLGADDTGTLSSSSLLGG